MSDGLLRQRRNLIVLCVLLWVMKYGGVSFTKFNLVGFDIAFKNPNALTTGIWIAFAYFFYRYYQYFTGEGISKLKTVFTDALNDKCHPVVMKIISANDPRSTNLTGYNYLYLKGNNWKYRWQTKLPDREIERLVESGRHGSHIEENSIDITRWMLKKPIASAILDSIFRHSVVTDYLLPFAIALWVLYYCGNTDWPGSFLNI